MDRVVFLFLSLSSHPSLRHTYSYLLPVYLFLSTILERFLDTRGGLAFGYILLYIDREEAL